MIILLFCNLQKFLQFWFMCFIFYFILDTINPFVTIILLFLVLIDIPSESVSHGFLLLYFLLILTLLWSVPKVTWNLWKAFFVSEAPYISFQSSSLRAILKKLAKDTLSDVNITLDMRAHARSGVVICTSLRRYRPLLGEYCFTSS